MIDSLGKLVESLETLPDQLQDEAVRQMEPVFDCLVDRHWDELFAATPPQVFDKMIAEADAKASEG